MYAAGMTLMEENYEKFKNAFEKQVKNSILEEQREPQISIDLELNFEDIDEKTIRILKQFEPFGPQNMTPVFVTKYAFDTGYGKPMGLNNEHLKLFLKQNNSEGYAAIGFGLGEKYNLITNRKRIEIAYSLSENEWNGKTSLQFMLKDLRGNEL
jgi:single-stranded-DNA-specific exonuclease